MRAAHMRSEEPTERMPIGIRHLTEDLIKLIRNPESLGKDRARLVLKYWSTWLQQAIVGRGFVDAGLVPSPKHSAHFEMYCSLSEIWDDDQAPKLIRSLLITVTVLRGMFERDETPLVISSAPADCSEALHALEQLIHQGWQCGGRHR